ncbi:MAG: membrane-bound O-acyltransferase family protein [Alphaproteobacteria bacterium]|nr:MAG: membrane-bound O-acyltransferase family protein [Alphaproteobacteria bacterium]
MLFNSQIFIYGFLPIVLAVYVLWGRRSIKQQRGNLAVVFLVLASLFFYGCWNVHYLALIVPLTVVNFYFGYLLSVTRSRWLLVFALGFNLLVLAYFKYAEFLTHNVLQPLGFGWDAGTVVLPLGISFFIFQIIAYLVDSYKGEVRDKRFWHFSLFVTFFPQLVAGPIVHHKDIIPQFDKVQMRSFLDNLTVGLTIFIFGLFKKVILADGVAEYSTPVFEAAAHGEVLGFADAWGAALAFTLQIYFDFSGYSDMAVGLARMFGIVLPLNFFSPYQAGSIVEFWRRWHMTLSCFLRDYLYIPLGGNRGGRWKQLRNLMVTMLLGGLWHGAAWTFVVWGALHGVYLVINHMWQRMFASSVAQVTGGARYLVRGGGWLVTFMAVVIAWVVFRADNLGVALHMLESMAGLHGVSVLQDGNPYFYGAAQVVFTGGLLLIVLFAPNSMTIMRSYRPALWTDAHKSVVGPFQWKPNLRWAFIVGGMAVAALISLNNPNEFLYFNF